MKKVILLSLAACLFATACNKNDLEFTKDGLPTNCAPNEIIYKTQYGYPIELKTDNSNFGGAKLVANLCEDGYCKYIFDADITQIPHDGFSGRVSLISMIIPNSVTSIGESAFNNCTSLTSITIPNSVTSIGSYAFSDCTSLASITIGSGVTSIGSYAFSDCTSLASVTIGNGVKSIGYRAFYNCTSLKAFYGKYASSDNRCLIVDGVLNSFAPAGLTEYTIPNSVTKIGDQAFYDCRSLTSVTIPDSVTSIGVQAFRNCRSLTSVTIPNSVTSIGYDAFYNCTSLKEVYCKPITPPSGHSDMFDDNASGRKIYVPRNSVNTYKSASCWKDYASYIEGYDF